MNCCPISKNVKISKKLNRKNFQGQILLFKRLNPKVKTKQTIQLEILFMSEKNMTF